MDDMANHLNKTALRDYYLNFRQTFASVIKERNTPLVPEKVWQEAIGWSDKFGYHPGKLTAALQDGRKLRVALGHVADSMDGRQAMFACFKRAAGVLSDTAQAKSLYYPLFNVPKGSTMVHYGTNREQSKRAAGARRGGSSQNLFKKEAIGLEFMWKYAEDHLVVQPVYERWSWFESDPTGFQKVCASLKGFYDYAVSLAVGNRGDNWKGLTDENVRRSWGLLVARKLIFFMEDLGVVGEMVCGKPEPFFLLELDRTTNEVETKFDLQQFCGSYGTLADLASQRFDSQTTDGWAGPVDWAPRSNAQRMQTVVAKWVGMLTHKRPVNRSGSPDMYWAQQAQELALVGSATWGDGRPVVIARLPVLSLESSSSNEPHPPAAKRTAADADGVRSGNDPSKKPRAEDPPALPPLSLHATEPMDVVATQIIHPLVGPSRPPILRPGLPQGGHGRDPGREAAVSGGGNLQGAQRMFDDDDSEEDIQILPQVSAAGNQGARPAKRPKREVKPEPLPAGQVAPLSIMPLPPPVIAEHPMASARGEMGSDFSAMVAQIVARYEEKYPDWSEGAVRGVVEAVAEIAQPQQYVQRFTAVVQPRVLEQGTEASGHFVFNSTAPDGRRVGIVMAYRAATPHAQDSFFVKIAGGSNDGDWMRVNADQGVYRASGPFPVLALANPSTSHGKIPKAEMNRLQDQRLALSREVIEMLIDSELRQTQWVRTAKASRLPNAEIPGDEDIQSYAGELVNRFKRGQEGFTTGTTASRWVNLGCARRWSQTRRQYRGIVLVKLRNFMTQIREGHAHPVRVAEVEKGTGPAVAVGEPGRGSPPSDISQYATLDTTNIALAVSLAIVVALLVFSD